MTVTNYFLGTFPNITATVLPTSESGTSKFDIYTVCFSGHFRQLKRLLLIDMVILFTVNMNQETSTAKYAAIFVPVAALLIIIVVGGIVFCIKHKR